MKGQSTIGVLARLRLSQVPVARAVLALFVTTWLCLAVQPCMAEAAATGDVATEQAATGHHAGCGDMPPPAPAHDCPHCPPGDHAGDCGTALDCASVGVPAMVSKAVEPPAADLGAWLDLPAPLPRSLADPAPLRATQSRHPPRASPRTLQQRYCSYLK